MRITFGFRPEELVFPPQHCFESGETPAGTRERMSLHTQSHI
jgi:hypothetical protein